MDHGPSRLLRGARDATERAGHDEVSCGGGGGVRFGGNSGEATLAKRGATEGLGRCARLGQSY
jgi:hypothetical protein